MKRTGQARTTRRGVKLALALLSAACGTMASADSLRERLETMLIEAGVVEDERLVAVSIFGDGDPRNGVEDSRVDMASGAWRKLSGQSWSLSGGTIHCDGKIRGSGMVVDTREHGVAIRGHVVLTSAHVLFDLERGQRYRDCRFHYMGLEHVEGYQGYVELARSRLGKFDPSEARSKPEFGRGDWALLYVSGLPQGASGPRQVRLRAYSDLYALDAGTSFQFLSFSRTRGGMTISTACHVVESMNTDLGAGGWKGHLLDDCDSEAGASGGGLIASVGDEHFLVGIRSGTHWDEEIFPRAEFPRGPPAGANWDVRTHTNFARAVDEGVIASLREMVTDLTRKHKKR